MRYGVIGDIHANLPALRVALAELERAEVDRVLCTGDLVGYGPHPNECVEAVAALDAVSVIGNHGLIVLDRLSDNRCIPLARASLRWTRSVLTAEAREFLATLPLVATTADGIVVAHGSLHDVQEYVTSGAQAARELETLRGEHPSARCLVLGHTHRHAAFDATGEPLRPDAGGVLRLPAAPVLLNPGAVGQSRELLARVRLLVLDLDEGTASFRALRYDIDSCRRDLRARGLSAHGCHLGLSYLPARIASALRRKARRRIH